MIFGAWGDDNSSAISGAEKRRTSSLRREERKSGNLGYFAIYL